VAAIVVGVLVAAALPPAAFIGMNLVYNYVAAPPAPRQPARSLAEARRDDLEALRGFLRADWGYTDATRSQASALIDRAERAATPSTASLTLLAARVAAIADNGHTNIRMAWISEHIDRIPIRSCVLRDGLFVVRARPDTGTLLGERIVAINGYPYETLRDALDAYTGGTADWRDARLPLYLEAPSLLQAAGYGGSSQAETLTVEDSQGARRSVSLNALPPDPDGTAAMPCQNLRPETMGKNRANWSAALAGRSDMLLFQGRPAPFYRQAVAAGRGYYVRFDQNDNDGGANIGAFARETERSLKAAQPAFVIVDMRFNSGGNYLLTAGFMRGLPAMLPKTRFYVLTSPLTFSAAMTSAVFIKYAGGPRAWFVGDWPGDRTRFRAEGGEYCLPRSHLCLMARTAIHDYTTKACEPLLQCFLPDRFFPAAIKSLQPDIYAPLTFQALSQGHDPAIDQVMWREAAIVPGTG
jgi:hypothetical protein